MDRQALKQTYQIKGSPQRVCLLIHGFEGTPSEMYPLAQALAKQGYSVLAVCLAGHGTILQELDASTWADWAASAARAFCRLRAQYETVHVIGQSMGALLALYLGQHYDPDTVTALAPAVRLADRRAPLAGLFRPFMKYRAWDELPLLEETRHYLCSYDKMSLAGLAQLQKLARRVRRDLPLVHQPLLLAYGPWDGVIDHAGVGIAWARVSSQHKECMILPRSGHVVTLDADRAALFRRIGRFLAAQEAARPL